MGCAWSCLEATRYAEYIAVATADPPVAGLVVDVAAPAAAAVDGVLYVVAVAEDPAR